MDWLDAVMPKDIGTEGNGTVRGTCQPGLKYQDTIQANQQANVIFKDIQLNNIK